MPRHPRRLLPAVAACLGLLVGVGVALAGPLAGSAAADARGGSAAAPPAAAGPGPVVLVGMSGLRWDDVSPAATPALARLAEQGSIADLTVRSVRRSACPVDGWLALSAGRRAGDTLPAGGKQRTEPECRPIEVQTGIAAPGSATVTSWQRYLRSAASYDYSAAPGLLGSLLEGSGLCATAIGPGAAVALARTDGTVVRYLADAPAAGLGALVGDPGCPLTVLDVGAVRDDDDPLPPPVEQGIASTDGDRATQVAAVDRRVGQVLDAAPAGARVLVVSLADDGATPHLQLAAAVGAGFGPGLLWTSSTRQLALVQATDLTPTVLGLLGVPAPAQLVGSPLQARTAAAGQAPATVADRLRTVGDLEQAAQRVQSLVAPFFNSLVIAQIVLYGIAAVVLRRRWATGPSRRRLLGVVRRVAVVFGCVPVATYLANTVPWWRHGDALLAVTAMVAVYVVGLSAVALLGPWRRAMLGPFGAVGAMTCIVLAADIVTGSRLQTSSLMGLQPLVAGRFYGFSNVAYALFATGALLLAVAVADALVRRGRRVLAAACVAGIGAVATVLDVSPQWGSDFGGPIAMVPAFAVLTLLVLGVRLSWRTIGLIAAGTVLLLAVVSVGDWLRPADQRTHLGRFVQEILDGGAWQIVYRKAKQNFIILFGSVLSALVPVAALFVALVLARPSSWGAGALDSAYRRSPVMRPGLVCLMVLLGIGFAVNDSGTAIPAVGFTVAIPLVIAASLRALERDETDDAPPAPAVPAAAPSPPTAPRAGGSPA